MLRIKTPVTFTSLESFRYIDIFQYVGVGAAEEIKVHYL
jgi:hypothetical protein